MKTLLSRKAGLRIKVFLIIFFGVGTIGTLVFYFLFNRAGGDLDGKIIIKALLTYFTVALFLATFFSLMVVKGNLKDEKSNRK